MSDMVGDIDQSCSTSADCYTECKLCDGYGSYGPDNSFCLCQRGTCKKIGKKFLGFSKQCQAQRALAWAKGCYLKFYTWERLLYVAGLKMTIHLPRLAGWTAFFLN